MSDSITLPETVADIPAFVASWFDNDLLAYVRDGAEPEPIRLLRERTNPVTIDCVYLAIRKTHARSELENLAGRMLSDHDLDSQRMTDKEFATALGKEKWCRDVAEHYNNQPQLEPARELLSVLEAERTRRRLLSGEAGLV